MNATLLSNAPQTLKQSLCVLGCVVKARAAAAARSAVHQAEWLLRAGVRRGRGALQWEGATWRCFSKGQEGISSTAVMRPASVPTAAAACMLGRYMTSLPLSLAAQALGSSISMQLGSCSSLSTLSSPTLLRSPPAASPADAGGIPPPSSQSSPAGTSSITASPTQRKRYSSEAAQLSDSLEDGSPLPSCSSSSGGSSTATSSRLRAALSAASFNSSFNPLPFSATDLLRSPPPAATSWGADAPPDAGACLPWDVFGNEVAPPASSVVPRGPPATRLPAQQAAPSSATATAATASQPDAPHLKCKFLLSHPETAETLTVSEYRPVIDVPLYYEYYKALLAAGPHAAGSPGHVATLSDFQRQLDMEEKQRFESVSRSIEVWGGGWRHGGSRPHQVMWLPACYCHPATATQLLLP